MDFLMLHYGWAQSTLWNGENRPRATDHQISPGLVLAPSATEVTALKLQRPPPPPPHSWGRHHNIATISDGSSCPPIFRTLRSLQENLICQFNTNSSRLAGAKDGWQLESEKNMAANLEDEAGGPGSGRVPPIWISERITGSREQSIECIVDTLRAYTS